MLELKERISNNLKEIVKDMGVDVDDIVLDIPKDMINGDISSNIAFRISKQLRRSPVEVANDIKEQYPKDQDIEKVEVVKPGFINFFFSDKYLLTVLKDINTQKERYFKLDILKGKRYVIEYTDANPFKTFHIGHLYTNMVGESFARLVEALGASVTRANYQGDIGLHVAKTLWGLVEMLKKEEISFDDLSKRGLVERVQYLGEAYMLGFQKYDDEKDADVINVIKDINYYIFSLYIPSLERKEYFNEFESLDIKRMYLNGKDWCLEYFERIYERTGTKFDMYYLESEVGNKGLNLVKENMDGNGKSIFRSSEGSVIYQGDEGKGLHTRVFVNSQGLPTYEAKDLALALQKYEDIKFDESIVITADEQTSYFKVVLDALSRMDGEVAKRSKHLAHGMVKLPGAKKMSSRKGKIVEAEWLLNEVKKKVEDVMRESKRWDEGQIAQVSDIISVASIKYSFIKVSVGKDVIFDIEKSTSFDGDTGPYLLYVYARCNSILNEKSVDQRGSTPGELDPHTKGLLRVLGKYRAVLLTSALNYSPSSVASYLFDLGQAFNSFYQNVRVLDSEDSDFLLGVVNATALTMKEGLSVLGIRVVERM